MPQRPSFPFEVERGVNIGDAFEHLRQGTRQQFESDWTSIVGAASATFTHGLGEVPWLVDVLRSETSDGKAPIVATGLTVARTDETVTVTTPAGTTYFYKVRAM